LRDGEFKFHPEYVGARTEQGWSPHTSLLIPATPFKVAKARDE
jgi:hypothetical protein